MATFNGTVGADNFLGTGDDDTFNGISLNDSVDGGAGSADAITINLSTTVLNVVYNAIEAATNTGWTSVELNMSVSNVERLTSLTTGSGDDMLIISNAPGEFFWQAGAGNDTLFGDFSNETLRIDAEGSGPNYYVRNHIYSFRGEAQNVEAVHIIGGSAGDHLRGTTGNDTFMGGGGNDTVYAGGGHDSVDGGEDNDNIQGENGNDSLLGGAGTDQLYGGVGTDSLVGGDDNDLLQGNIGDDVLEGGGGDDQLQGEDGSDTASYVTATSAVTVDLSAGAIQNTGGAGTDELYSIENLTGSGYNDTLTGDSNANILDGGGSNDFLQGAAGNDSLVGGVGNDDLYGGDDNDTVDGGGGTDQIFGESGDDSLSGGDDDDYLYGDVGNDTLTGGNGYDILFGSYDNDNLDGGAGTDEILGEDGDDSLNGGADNDTLYGDAGNDTIHGEDGDDLIDGGSGVNVLTGGLGNDSFDFRYVFGEISGSIDGGDGTDLLYAEYEALVGYTLTGVEILETTGGSVSLSTEQVQSLTSIGVTNSPTQPVTVNLTNGGVADFSSRAAQGAFVNASAAGNTITTGSSADTLIGGAGTDSLNGGGGDDLIQGKLGPDTLTGGLGNDTFFVDAAGQVVIELSGEGTDIIYSQITWSLAGSEVENLTLMGSNANLNGTGNALNNEIIGNGGNNDLRGHDGDDALNGGIGVDTMRGGLGDDSYYVDNAGDVVSELSGQGTDTVFSSVTWSLSGGHAENLTLTGTANIDATGNNSANVLTGNSGNNRLDGGNLGDTMQGGAGDDTYIINSASDVVIENASEGTDTVRANRNHTLGTHFENLVLLGSGNFDGVGNALDNDLAGNTGNNILNGLDGNDILNGGSGADTLRGGLGDDTYVVNETGDVVNELSGQGIDTVQSSISFNLTGLFAENIVLTGSANINATGNGQANALTGNGFNNVLNGLVGADTMAGGGGDDSYYVDNIGDVVIEASNKGTDTVFSSVSFNLAGIHVETLSLTGSSNINATGNGSANTLSGNSGNNTITGLGGSDILTGGLGADLFLFGTGSGADSITDFTKAQGDLININAYTGGIANAGLVTQSGLHVLISLGGGNTITVQNTTTADVLTQIVW